MSPCSQKLMRGQFHLDLLRPVMGKVRPFCRSGLEDNFWRPIAAFCLKKFVEKSHTITSLTADESSSFFCAAGKILHRAYPITKLI